MHHCVSTYAAKCIGDNASIWVLRRTALGKIERLLTIELDPQAPGGAGARFRQPSPLV
ncbi:hypothetical protein [Mesorhizobium sp. M0643]|uniref:hypothetical protein n=1 Tax=Mesorhizobium sp. M0643 TaxID=2956978 RepID=UPI00333BCF5C